MKAYPNIENCRPQNCIASKAMKTQRIISGIFRNHLQGFDLTTPQLSMLFVLAKGGAKQQKNLAEMLYLEKSSINRSINKLADKDYVQKIDFPLIEITLKGKDLLEKVIPHWDKAMSEVNELMTEKGVNALNCAFEHLTTKK